MTTKMSRQDLIPVINWPPRSGTGIQDYRSKDTDPKEIFTDSHHSMIDIE
jgi:hypothetical protein